MIHIFTVCTGAYDNSWHRNKINTINNIFPGYHKSFNLISDKNLLETFKDILNDDFIQFNYYHICNLVYPFVTLHKYDYIYDMCYEYKYDKNDFFIYFDANSFCIKKENEYWENLLYNHLMKYDICYAINPYIYDNFIYNEIDKRSKHYISKKLFNKYKKYWSQMSFLMGNIKSLYNFKNAINQLLLDDIFYSDNNSIKQCILPNFMEQHYANYLFFDIFLNNKDYGFTIHNDNYICRRDKIDIKSFIICHIFDKNVNAIMNKKTSRIYNPLL